MMFEIRAFVMLAALCATSACDPGSARVTVEQTQPASPQLSMLSAAAAPTLKISAVVTTVAEDGQGHRVSPPKNPRALDLVAPQWRGRALDPVLHVGDLHFHTYSFEGRQVMRFVVDDVARLRSGSEVWLQWGDDESSRVVISSSLEVPK